MSKFAWVTLTTNDTYSLGALVLAHSLRRTGTAHQLAVLVTPTVSESMRQRLQDVYNVVQEVNILDSQDAANLALLARPELGVTFTKLHCWRLVQFEKCVFLDADTLVLQNVDELFEREELSAAPDVSWPDCFNSGVFVYRPSLETFAKIVEFAIQNGSFDGGDQGLLNSYFADWAQSDIKKHLPFIYNVAAFASYCYLPAFKQFRDKIKILHFAGKLKPWLIQFNSENRSALTPTEYAHAADLIQLWWNIFCDNVHQTLSNTMCGTISHYYYHHYQTQILAQQSQNIFFHHQYEYDHHGDQQQYHHEDYQQHDQNETSSEMKETKFYEFENIKEFHDPWEDYYENLANEKYDNVMEDNNNVNEIQIQQHQIEEEWNKRTTPESTTLCHIHEVDKSEANRNREHILFEERLMQYTNDQCQQKKIEIVEEEKPIEHYENIDDSHVFHQPQEAYEPSTNDFECHTNNEANFENQVKYYEIDIHNKNTATKEEQDFSSIHTDDATISNNASASKNTNCTDASKICSVELNEKLTENNNNENEAGLAGALSQLRLGEQRTPEQEAYEQLMRRQCWESGQIDYAGKDSFDNIWKKIQETMDSKPSASVPKVEEEKSVQAHSKKPLSTKISKPKPNISGIDIVETESERLERINRLLHESAIAFEEQKDEHPLLATNIDNASLRSKSPANNKSDTNNNRPSKRAASPNPVNLQTQQQQQQPRRQTQTQPQHQQNAQAPQRPTRHNQQPHTSQQQQQTRQISGKSNRKSK